MFWQLTAAFVSGMPHTVHVTNEDSSQQLKWCNDISMAGDLHQIYP